MTNIKIDTNEKTFRMVQCLIDNGFATKEIALELFGVTKTYMLEKFRRQNLYFDFQNQKENKYRNISTDKNKKKNYIKVVKDDIELINYLFECGFDREDISYKLFDKCWTTLKVSIIEYGLYDLILKRRNQKIQQKSINIDYFILKFKQKDFEKKITDEDIESRIEELKKMNIKTTDSQKHYKKMICDIFNKQFDKKVKKKHCNDKNFMYN